MAERLRVATWLLFLALAGTVPQAIQAADDCRNAGWSEQQIAARGDDSGLGGTGVAGDDSGLGGTGVTGDDSGIGGTGIFGTITSTSSICVNGVRIRFGDEVVVVFEAGTAVGAGNLAVGQTVWLVAHPGKQGLQTDQIWVLPVGASARAWLDERIEATGPLARLSVEGPVDRWVDPQRFEVVGVLVDATARDVRSLVDSASQVRVSGSLTRAGILRVDRIAVTARPPRRPVRPVDRSPRISPPINDRPVRPDSSLRPNRTDKVKPKP